jgi:hypothetical protein
VRVGVKEAVLQHLLDNQARGAQGNLARVVSCGAQGVYIVHLDTLQPLHHQQTLGAVFGVELRDMHFGRVGKVASELLGVAHFASVVQLAQQREGEVFGDGFGVVQLAQLRALRQVRQVVQDFQVQFYYLAQVRALDFHGDGRPIVQSGSVDLRQRRRADGFGVYLAEHLVQRASEFRLNQRAHGRPRLGGGVVLELAQFVNKRVGQQVGAGAENLSQLDEGRSEFLHRDAQVLRGRFERFGGGAQFVLAERESSMDAEVL